jgi:hypothetical protein
MRSDKLKSLEWTEVHKQLSIILVFLLFVVLILVVLGIGYTSMDEEDSAQSPPSSSVQQPPEENIAEVQVLDDVESEGVIRFVDQSAGTVCYVYRVDVNDVSVGGTGGLSCLPLNETSLSMNRSD